LLRFVLLGQVYAVVQTEQPEAMANMGDLNDLMENEVSALLIVEAARIWTGRV
jgi:hypothetical protein